MKLPVGMQARRNVVTTVAAAIAAAALTPGIVSARTVTGPDGCGTLVPTLKGWEVPTPRYPDGSQSTSTYAVDPWRSKTLLVTNSSIVMKSSDGGCSWRTVFSLSKEMADGPLPVGGDGSIESIITAGRPSASYYLVVNGGFDTGSLGQPHIYRSRDGGSSWQLADDGLPIEATASHLVFAPSDPDTGYLVIGHGAAGLGGISFYCTHDGGDSWEAATEPTETLPTSDEVEASASVRDLAVSPIDPMELWITTSDGVHRSDDGGRNWKPVTNLRRGPSPEGLGAIQTSSGSAEETIRIFSSSPSDPTNYVSKDRGRTWHTFFTPGPLESAVEGDRPDEVIGAFNADGTRVFIYRSNRWIVLTDFGGASYSTLQRDFTARPRFYLSSGSSLWIYQPTDIQLARRQRISASLGGFCSRPHGGELKTSMPQSASLTPERLDLTLAPGALHHQRYQLTLDAAATPVDLYFLIDASGSMGPALCGAANASLEIATRLAERGIDSRFGLGTYQDLAPRDPVQDCYAYRRDIDLAPLDESFVSALFGVTTCGGTEPQMTALEQSATGSGVPAMIPPGQNATFRSTAMPVIVHISDEPMNETIVQRELAISALNSKGIRQVGIDTGPGATPSTAYRSAGPWLRYVAGRTNAIATSPVDCDGDNVFEIQPGQPLVCNQQLSDASASKGIPMADAIVNMVLSLVDDVPVRLVDASKSPALTKIEPALYPNVDLKQPNDLDFHVTYKCSVQDLGQTFSVELEARALGRTVASATASVTCAGTPTGKRSLPGPGVVTLALVPPGPLPVQQSQPQPQPRIENQMQQQAQQQTQANAQAAAVAQRQEQPQMAFVHAAQQLKEQTAGQHAVLRTVQQRQDSLASVKFGLAMSAISMLLIYGLATSTVRTRLARNRRG